MFISHAVFLFQKQYLLFKVHCQSFAGMINQNSERSCMCAVTVYSNILHDCKANICTLLSCLFINAVSFIFDDTIVLYSLLIYKTLVCPKKCPYLQMLSVFADKATYFFFSRKPPGHCPGGLFYSQFKCLQTLDVSSSLYF